MLFSLLIISLNQEKTYMIVLPSVMGLFPSMVLGALMCSMIGGGKFLIEKINLTFRLFSSILICLGIFILGLAAQVFFKNSIYAIMLCSILGLAMGYTFADWHVLLYRSIYSNKLIIITSLIFVIGYFCAVALYGLLFSILEIWQTYTASMVICFILALLLVAVTYIDGLVNQANSNVLTTVINDFFSVQLKLLFLIFAVSQVIILAVLIEFCVQKNIYGKQWASDLTNSGASWLAIISILFYLLVGVYLLNKFNKKYLFFFAQVVVVITICLFLVNMLFMSQYSILLYMCVFFAYGGAILMSIVFNLYVITFFKSGVIGIFVPITTAIFLFFITLYQSVAPVLVTISISNGGLSLGVILIGLLFFVTLVLNRLCSIAVRS
jgi:hypothetical protein